MQPPNIKIYLMISGALIVLFLIVTFVPFGKKSTDQEQQINFPTPTSVEIDKSAVAPTIEPGDFTGVAEEELPAEATNLSLQKQDLRGRLPLELSTFTIDFDYSEDRFVVTLIEPKDQARVEFENWRSANYPALNISQFNFR